MTFFTNAINLPKPASIDRAELGIDRLIEVSEETGDDAFISNINAMTSNGEYRPFLDALFGNSPFLSHCVNTDPIFFLELIMAGPEASFKKIEQELTKKPENLDEPKVMQFLRIHRKQGALTIAAADIAGLWTGPEITQALSRFSDLYVQYAINFLLQNMAAKKILNLPDENNPGEGSGLIVLGMGKLGSHELNYSSDIDLIIFLIRKSSKPTNLKIWPKVLSDWLVIWLRSSPSARPMVMFLEPILG